MTLAANVGHLRETGWSGPMFPMTGGTVRGAEILFFEQGHAMNALSVQLILIDGEIIRPHIFTIGVTTVTHGGDIGRVNARGGLVGGVHPVATMAIETGGHLGVTFFQPLPVNGLLEFGPLVGGKVVLAHQVYIGMAGGA